MIFLACYAVAIWWGVYTHRRRWGALIVLAAGLPPVALVAWFDVHLAQWFLGEDTSWLYIPAIAFGALVAIVSVFIAVQPRSLPEHACECCQYDLRGNVLGLCPECGEPL